MGVAFDRGAAARKRAPPELEDGGDRQIPKSRINLYVGEIFEDRQT